MAENSLWRWRYTLSVGTGIPPCAPGERECASEVSRFIAVFDNQTVPLPCLAASLGDKGKAVGSAGGFAVSISEKQSAICARRHRECILFLFGHALRYLVGG